MLTGNKLKIGQEMVWALRDGKNKMYNYLDMLLDVGSVKIQATDDESHETEEFLRSLKLSEYVSGKSFDTTFSVFSI